MAVTGVAYVIFSRTATLSVSSVAQTQCYDLRQAFVRVAHES